MADSSSEFDNSEDTKIWNNTNIFTKNINFSKDQKFPILNLDYANYPVGSLIFANGVSWDILKPNLTNQFLTFTANGLQWHHLQFSNINGVLPVSQGGTGWSILPEKGLLINSAKEVLDLLPFPNDFHILSSNNNEAEWISFQSIVDEVSKKFKTINVSSNIAELNHNNPIFKLSDGIVASGIAFDSNKFKFNLSTNTTNFGEYNSNFNSLTLSLDILSNNFKFKINDSTVLTIKENGILDNCQITADQILGILPIDKGGVGDLNYQKGDILYCPNDKQIGLLSCNDKEGFYLQVKDGLPQFTQLDKNFLDGNLNVPLVLSSTKNDLPPLRFQRASLLENTIEGSIEYDGYNLFLTTALGRKALSFMSSDISGKASNVTGIVSLKNGGTGTDLEEIAIGQILVKNENSLNGFETGNYGQILMSQGQGAYPTWTYAINDIETSIDSGIKIIKNGSLINLSVDQTFSPIWQKKHKFLNDVEFSSQLFLSSQNKSPIKFDITSEKAPKNAGELWFDGSELYFNTGNKTIALTEQYQNEEYKQNHLLTLAAGAEIFENKRIRMKVPVPYLATKKNLATANWKIKYIHMIADEATTSEDASFKLYLNEKVISDINIPIGNIELINSNFKESILSSGQFLQLECVKTGNSNYWSAFLMIEIM